MVKSWAGGHRALSFTDLDSCYRKRNLGCEIARDWTCTLLTLPSVIAGIFQGTCSHHSHFLSLFGSFPPFIQQTFVVSPVCQRQTSGNSHCRRRGQEDECPWGVCPVLEVEEWAGEVPGGQAALGQGWVE